MNNISSVSADSTKMFLNLQYSGDTAERLVKSFIKKLYKCLKKDTNNKFIVCYKNTKLSFYTNTKDKTLSLAQLSLVYKFTCPGCRSSYMGKTERTLVERTEERAYSSKKKNDQSVIFEHLSSCSHYDHI